MERVNREFDGHDVTEFFLSYGSPSGSEALSTGGKNYRWISLELHGGPRHATAIMANRHFGTIGGTENGEMMNGYCEIRILADEDDRIRKLTLVYDSIGKYSGSRCAEIFAEPPPR